MKRRYAIVVAALVVAGLAMPALAWARQAATSGPAQAETYSVESTEIGILMDDPAARRLIDRHVPGFSTDQQFDVARSMSLRAVQRYAPDKLSDAVLARIEEDLKAMPGAGRN